MVKREGEFSYPIWFERNMDSLPEALAKAGLAGRRCLLVTDSTVGPLYAQAVLDALQEAECPFGVFTFPAGEKHKNLEVIRDIYECLIEDGMDRTGFLAALGGGVVGDMTGFAAATYLRGVDFIQIPTTLLSQVDSSVGGKTGVDFLSYKNMVGAFHQPRLVYMALDTLRTLEDEQFSSGMGEVLKTALLADGDLYRDILSGRAGLWEREYETLADVIRRCVSIKAEIVERDPKEKGERALLNLGHTIGHAIEKSKDFTLLHGQCVGLGLLAAARISRERGLLSEEEVRAVEEGCEIFALPKKTEGLSAEEVLAATKKDKKMEQGRVKFILLNGLGHAFVDRTVTEEEMRRGIESVLS